MREVSNGHQNQSIKRVFCSIAGIPNHLVNQFNIFPPINILVIRNTNTLKGTWSRRESGARVSLDQRQVCYWDFGLLELPEAGKEATNICTDVV